MSDSTGYLVVGGLALFLMGLATGALLFGGPLPPRQQAAEEKASGPVAVEDEKVTAPPQRGAPAAVRGETGGNALAGQTGMAPGADGRPPRPEPADTQIEIGRAHV